MPDPKSSKGKGTPKTPKTAQKPETADDENAEPPPPPPLLLRFDVEMKKWKTAADCKNQFDV